MKAPPLDTAPEQFGAGQLVPARKESPAEAGQKYILEGKSR